MSIDECRINEFFLFYFLKRAERSDIHNSSIVIRHSMKFHTRFQFEVEILVKAAWEQLPVIEVPVSVSYAPGKERISHFRPFIDFLRNTGTFARLITQRILIHPFVRKS